MVICAGMVPFICADGYIRLPYLAQRHQGLSDQGKPDNIHYSIIPEYLVVVCFLWLEVTPLWPYRDRPTVDSHITVNHQFFPCFENRFLSADTLYYLDKLRHCAKFLHLHIESIGVGGILSYRKGGYGICQDGSTDITHLSLPYLIA